MRILSIIFIIFGILAWSTFGNSNENGNEQIIYKKQLEQGRLLQIVKSRPVTAPDFVASTFTSKNPDEKPVQKVFSISLELFSKTGDRCTLWSQTAIADDEKDSDACEVLDAITRSGEIILVIASNRQISLYRVEVFGSTSVFSLKGADWSLLAGAVPLKRDELVCKLEFDKKMDVLSVEITDHLQDTTRHTLFRQDGQDWKFKAGKQWEEKSGNI